MIYPHKINSKKSDKIINSLAMASIIIVIVLIIINKLTTPEIPWAALANCGIIYIWITVIYSIKRNTNIAGHVLLQLIITSMVVLYIDDTIGFNGWSVSIAVPIILIVANVTMLILTVVSYKKYIRYALYQIAIVLITLISIGIIIKIMNTLSIIAIGISIVNLVISLVLSYKDIKDEIIRKFHM